MDENLLRISCFVAIVWNSENNDKFVAIVKFINTLVVKIYLKELQLNYFADWKLLIAQLKYCQKEGNVFYHTLIKTKKTDKIWRMNIEDAKMIFTDVLQINHDYVDIVRCVLENGWEMIWRSWSNEKRQNRWRLKRGDAWMNSMSCIAN